MAQLLTIEAVERELDAALIDLRALDRAPLSHLVARAAIEYRIGALRRRKATLDGMANPGH
jgi:hypothetical protein